MAGQKGGSHGRILEFIALAEKVSGKPLHELFQTWLYTAGKPSVGPNGAAPAAFTARAASVKPKSYDQIQANHRVPRRGTPALSSTATLAA